MATTLSKRMRKIYETAPANTVMSAIDAFETLKNYQRLSLLRALM